MSEPSFWSSIWSWNITWWQFDDTHLKGVFEDYEVSQSTQTLLGIYLTITGLIGILANFLVLGMFFRTKGRLSPSSMVLLNLTVSDICILFLGFPTHTIANFQGKWVFGDIGCVLYGFFGFLFGTAHIGTLSLLSYEQYRNISEMKPHSVPTQKYLDRLHRKYSIYVTLIWIFAIFWACLPLAGWSRYYYEPYGTACTIDWQNNDIKFKSYIIAYFCGGYICPFGLMMYSYIRMLNMKKSYQVRHRRQLSVKCDIMDSLKKSREEDLTLLALLTVITFLITWTPYALLCVFCVFDEPENVPTAFILAPSIAAKTSGALNPFIYTITSETMRGGMFETLNKVTVIPFSPAAYLKEMNNTLLYEDDNRVEKEDRM